MSIFDKIISFLSPITRERSQEPSMSILDKVTSFLSPITQEIGATHFVVIFYNDETDVLQGIGTFNGFNDILHGAEVIEEYANQLRNGVTLQ